MNTVGLPVVSTVRQHCDLMHVLYGILYSAAYTPASIMCVEKIAHVGNTFLVGTSLVIAV